ncbi:hypothetical protein GCM10010218_34130 [Streptomyces mashuensis]|uniref:GntR family transcriptional regulator n=2 Tax=Streptomyces mashuensis TaxID=33904 RepID=A0A919EDP5_9ACTN|nr:hypothetical protein GCM10010218_34130 [Streptomyces mashuensis]
MDYLRIAAELRARIASGELGPGEKVPSTRRITQEWGVAMATAGRALAVLREEGLVRTVPGVGTLVATDGAPRRGRRPRARVALTREQVVRTAIAIADARGSAALSMRSLAAALGVPTMMLYRHVPGKAGLLVLMAETVRAEAPDRAACPGAVARRQWELYRRHPWLVATPPPSDDTPLTASVTALLRGLALRLGEGAEPAGLEGALEFGLERLVGCGAHGHGGDGGAAG